MSEAVQNLFCVECSHPVVAGTVAKCPECGCEDCVPAIGQTARSATRRAALVSLVGAAVAFAAVLAMFPDPERGLEGLSGAAGVLLGGAPLTFAASVFAVALFVADARSWRRRACLVGVALAAPIAGAALAYCLTLL